MKDTEQNPEDWLMDEFFWDSVFADMLTSLASKDLTRVGGLDSSARSFAAAAAHRLAGPTLLITPSVADSMSMRDDLKSILGNVLYFPAYETLPFEGEPAHPGVISDRVECMNGLLSGNFSTVVVAPASALVKRIPPPEYFSCFRLYIGMRLSVENLENWLLSAGYLREESVWEQARWARRGGIIDVGTYGMDNPIRLEFFGDELESIRTFDQRSQRSIRNLQECRLLPAREAFLSPEHWNLAIEKVSDEHPLSEKLWTSNGFPGIEHYLPVFFDHLSGILDYIPDGGTLILSDPESIIVHMRNSLAFHRDNFISAKLPFEFEKQFFRSDEILENLETFSRILRLEPFPRSDVDIYYKTLPQENFIGHRNEMLRQFMKWTADGCRIAVLCDSEAEKETFAELLPENIPVDLSVLSISEGFHMPESGLVILAERRLLSGRRRPERIRKFRGGEGITDSGDISPGELVVHRRYGIGRFTGLEQVKTSGVILDCLAIEYRDGDRLLVPINEIGSVQKYMAPDRINPRLDKIGGASWTRRVSGARKKAREIAGRLAMLYARRKAIKRDPLGPPGHHVTALERSFPYEETPDQRKTIGKIMDDFENDCPMDRLVCGDVGYGKTEVAIRAVFRVVDSGFQAAVLVPTTVLAEQHYFTFRDRLAEFPARVEMLSRFRTKQEQKQILADIAVGDIDIIIGTHRILQKDIRFHKLGLLVTDEEHRFGVKQKEYFRELKAGVDTLSMTATPIPRTLHMALSGFRKISIIATPPRDRYPIHTELVGFNARIIAKAVLRELERDGQVFFVHNRIQSIERIREKLESILPEVSIIIGHGQMKPRELEDVMHSFMEGRYDILLCTSIIESGLDLPRVNTIFIDNAQMFGLAELYQLRGRVGRSHHQAYCYLIVPENQKLKPEARNRLDAIRRYTELGSGWNIAMRDLEIRGAGELLGASQHGQMISIGYALFERLIEQEVKRLKGLNLDSDVTVRVEIPDDSFIPPEYIPDVSERVKIYRSVWRADSEDKIDEWIEYLTDRFGKPEQPVLNCAERARLHYLARGSGIEEVVISGSKALLVFSPGAEVSRSAPDGFRTSVRDRKVSCLDGFRLSTKVEKTGRIIVSIDLKGVSHEGQIKKTAHFLRLFQKEKISGSIE